MVSWRTWVDERCRCWMVGLRWRVERDEERRRMFVFIIGLRALVGSFLRYPGKGFLS